MRNRRARADRAQQMLVGLLALFLIWMLVAVGYAYAGQPVSLYAGAGVASWSAGCSGCFDGVGWPTERNLTQSTYELALEWRPNERWALSATYVDLGRPTSRTTGVLDNTEINAQWSGWGNAHGVLFGAERAYRVGDWLVGPQAGVYAYDFTWNEDVQPDGMRPVSVNRRGLGWMPEVGLIGRRGHFYAALRAYPLLGRHTAVLPAAWGPVVTLTVGVVTRF